MDPHSAQSESPISGEDSQLGSPNADPSTLPFPPDPSAQVPLDGGDANATMSSAAPAVVPFSFGEPPPQSGRPEVPAWGTEANNAGSDGGASDNIRAASPGGTDSSSLPAHLQLPTMDFSVPSFDTRPPSEAPHPTAATTTASAGASAALDVNSGLPAHLQLPSFPQFDMSGIPGMPPESLQRTAEPPSPAAQTQPPQAPSGAVGPPPRPPPPPHRRSQPHGQSSELASMEPTSPPAMQRPPQQSQQQQRQEQEQEQEQEQAGLDLPDFGLLALNAQPSKKTEVTLIDSDAAEELAHTSPNRMAIWPILLILLLAGGGTGAWFGRTKIIQLITKADKSGGIDKATEEFLLGQDASTAKKPEEAIKHYRAALALRPNYPEAHLWLGLMQTVRKEFGPAEDHLQAAIRLKPNYGQAHRALGSTYAMQQKAEQAVEHYKKYLEFEPGASDAADVRKIVDDYEKAQNKKGEAKTDTPENEPEDDKAPTPATKQKGKGRRR